MSTLGISPRTPYDDLPEQLTVDEFITVTRVSRAWAYDAVRRDRIPGVLRFGRTIRIPKNAINSFVAK